VRSVAVAACAAAALKKHDTLPRRQRWLAPGGLWDTSDPECAVSASLLPFWAFDAVADVRYRGKRGRSTQPYWRFAD
jgi:hypothetical protein